jgi:chromate transporter
VKREQLFKEFLAILGMSAVSWGGLALIAQLEARYVRKYQALSAEAFADLVAVAWTVPGPVGCNLVLLAGYTLFGSLGAGLLALASVIPFFSVMTAFAWAYEHHVLTALVAPRVMERFALVLLCLIGTTLVRQSKSLLTSPAKWAIAVAATTLLHYFSTPGVFVGVLGGAFLLGWFTAPTQRSTFTRVPPQRQDLLTLALAGLLLGAYVVLPAGVAAALAPIRYAGAGLTLFGGGFSALPVLRELYLGGIAPLTDAAFRMAFSLTSVSPGPLLNVVPFLGYLRAGFPGSVLDTCAFFIPAGMLATLALKWRNTLREHHRFEHALGYLRAVTTAFLACAVMKLLPQVPLTSVNVVLAIVCSVVLWCSRTPVFWLYAGVAGLSLCLSW